MSAVFRLSQVFHLLVVAYLLRFAKFGFTVVVPNVITAEPRLGEDLKWMIPQFATIWVQVVFQIYFLLSVMDDILTLTPKTLWMSFKRSLAERANNMFTFYVTPFILVMCGNFWIIFSLDRDLVDEYRVVFGPFDRETNHIFHTYVIPLTLIEMCVTRRRFPPSATLLYPYVKIATGIASYFGTVFVLKLFSPVWPYPFFKAMTVGQWVAYISFNLLLSCISYVLAFYCNSFVWGKKSVQCSSTSDAGGVREERSMWGKQLLRTTRWTALHADEG